MENVRIVPVEYDIRMSTEDYHKLIEKFDYIYSMEQKIESLNGPNSKMIKKIQAIVNQLRWNNDLINTFVGQLLTEPIETAVFQPRKPVSLEVFKRNLSKKTLRLDPKTRMLFIKNNFYINGEFINASQNLALYLKQLANDKKISFESILSKKDLNALGIILLPLYLAGFIDFIQ